MLLVPSAVAAAPKVFNGGIAVTQDYDSNINREPSGEVSEWTSRVSPHFGFRRSGRKNEVSFEYAPEWVYSHRTDETRLDHFLNAGLTATPLRHWVFEVNDRFIKAADPYEDEDPDAAPDQGIRLSDRRGRNRYWTNHFNVGANYEYARQSVAEVSYGNQVLESEDIETSDFVRHSAEASILHRISQRWEAELAGGFAKGDFDDEEDLTSMDSDFSLYRHLSPRTRIQGSYGFSKTDYDRNRADYYSHTISAGMAHQFSATLGMDLAAGYSLLNSDDEGDQDTMYFRASADKDWQRQTLALSASGGFDQQYFSGTDEEGLSRYWQVESLLTRELTRDLTGRVRLSYREDEFLERTPSEKERQFGADARLSYDFGRWYRFEVRYGFTDLDADAAAESYEDHRFMMQVSANKDLFRW